MEQHNCAPKSDNNQPRAIEEDTEADGCKRLDNDVDIEEKFDFVGCEQIFAGDEEPFRGPFRLKDGLFFSLRSVVLGQEFLMANKISHIVAIEDAPGQPFEDSEGTVASDTSTVMAPPRILTLNWQSKESSGGQPILKQKLSDLATAVHFIDEAVQQGGSCLVHSVDDLTTAATAAMAYFTVK
ncbi:hypothetical protein, conserved [Eimeria brunetti]|uniref:Uncharacterized protein n=1 Tax=Eimeria brunetti TaxID=51314 RepID=U6LKF1_9EIME|nr:hypothetical protein, conserved [Eimeria brunetti]